MQSKNASCIHACLVEDVDALQGLEVFIGVCLVLGHELLELGGGEVVEGGQLGVRGQLAALRGAQVGQQGHQFLEGAPTDHLEK